MDASSPTVIQRKLNSSKLLTVDVPVERLYWVEDSDTFNIIYSIKFDGSDKKVTN